MLRAHEATHGEKNVTCATCGKSFHNRIQLRKHTASVHGERKFVCDYCGKGFHCSTFLIQHIRIHTGEKPYKCHICGVRYAARPNLTNHLKKGHHNKGEEPLTGRLKKRKQKKSLRKVKNDKKIAKGNKDDSKSSSKVQQSNAFKYEVPIEVVTKKGVNKSKKVKENNSTALDSSEDDIPLKEIKKKTETQEKPYGTNSNASLTQEDFNILNLFEED